jgi:hypothetical protein
MAQAKSGSGTKSRSTSARSAKGSKSSASSRRTSSAASPASSSRSAAGSRSSQNGGGSKAAVIAGIATGAAGLIGGAVLGSRLGRKPRKVLGVAIPGTGNGLHGLAKQVGKAGKELKKASKQVAHLTDEVRAAREKAEEVGKVIS